MNQREIKFRIHLQHEETGRITSLVFDYAEIFSGKALQKIEAMTRWIVLGKAQYTGLKDKNGKEIYEGDILCVFDEAVVPVTDEGQGPIEQCNHLVAVEMRNGMWGFEIPKSDDGEKGWHELHYWNEEISSDGFEVIGNIYENPELLQ